MKFTGGINLIPAKLKIVTTESEFMNSQIPQEPIPFLWSIYLSLHLEFSSQPVFSEEWSNLSVTDHGCSERGGQIALIGPDTLCGLWIVCVMMARGYGVQ